MTSSESTPARLKGRLAAIHRWQPDADTSELRRELRTATLAQHIKKVVDAAPPLTAEQRARLAALFSSAG